MLKGFSTRILIEYKYDRAHEYGITAYYGKPISAPQTIRFFDDRDLTKFLLSYRVACFRPRWPVWR